MKRLLIALSLLAAVSFSATAQFSTDGDNPAGLKWSSMDTRDYRIIFPTGSDSLARAYGLELQKFAPRLKGSLGFSPNMMYSKPHPVVLNTLYSISNGSVTWAPRRMSLYTFPDPYASEAMPWMTNLAVHEGRHVAQLQFSRSGFFKGFHWFLGEMLDGALDAVYPGPHLLEGDAVVAETALTQSGRGRSADFLGYFNMAMDQGDFRNWYRWRYGSQKYYTPDHYLTGYQTIAGIRYFWNDPLFMQRYFDGVTHHPLRIGRMQKTVKDASGMRFKATWKDLQEKYAAQFKEEAALREPFMTADALVQTPKRFTTWYGTACTDDGTYAIKSSLTRPSTLVKISPDGKESTVRLMSSQAFKLSYDKALNRLYWSEPVPSPRWDLKQSSRIRYYEPASGRSVSLTISSRMVNPSPSPDGLLVTAVEYPYEGGSRLVLVDAYSGGVKASLPAPDSLQLTEPVWIPSDENGRGTIYVSGLSDKGFGIYSVPVEGYGWPGAPRFKGSLRQELAPQPVKVKQLVAAGSAIAFCSDRTGVNEIYQLENGKVFQLTSTRYGACDPSFKDGKLLFSELRPEGRILSTATLSPKEVEFADIHKWVIADALSEQEKALAAGSDSQEPNITEPRHYSKIGNLIHFHSWAPFYFKYDEIAELSSDVQYDDFGIGATGFFQNTMGNSYGSVAVSMHKNPDSPDDGWNKDNLMAEGHIKYTYTGLPVVFSGELHFGDRTAREYGYKLIRRPYAENPADTSSLYIGSSSKKNYRIHGTIKAYVPISFSSGGWNRGLVPQVSYNLSNDRYTDNYDIYTYRSDDDKAPIITHHENNGSFLGRLDVSLRFYNVQQTPTSRIYPRLGLGVEVGGRTYPGLGWGFTPSYYAYAYGYLPGIGQTHGIRLSATVQANSKKYVMYGANTVTCSPRGFADSGAGSVLSLYCPMQSLISAEYAIPFAPVGWSFLSPVAYIRNFEAIPFFEYTSLSFSRAYNYRIETGRDLYSAGMDLNVRLGNIAWVPYPVRAGITIAYNGGSSYQFLEKLGQEPGKIYLGFHFDVDL